MLKEIPVESEVNATAVGAHGTGTKTIFVGLPVWLLTSEMTMLKEIPVESEVNTAAAVVHASERKGCFFLLFLCASCAAVHSPLCSKRFQDKK